MSKDEEGASSDYEVGHGRPPKHTQFKKGRSGNPNGRPKTKKADATSVSEILNEPVKVKVKAGGKTRDMSPYEVSVRQLAKRALDKDFRAILQFVEICEKYGVIAPPTPPTSGGVIWAPRGVDFDEWVDSITEEVPADEA